MAYPHIVDPETMTVGLNLDLIDMLVAVTELTEKHKSLPDSDVTKPLYKELAIKLNGQISEDMHRLGLKDLYEVRNRLNFSVRNIIKAKSVAVGALQKLVDDRV